MYESFWDKQHILNNNYNIDTVCDSYSYDGYSNNYNMIFLKKQELVVI